MQAVVAGWGEIAGILAALSAALSSLQVRALGADSHPLVVNGLRCGVAAVGFTIIWLLGGAEAGQWMNALPLVATGVAFGLIVGDSLYFSAITRIGSGKATQIAMSYPLPTAALAAILFGETLTTLKISGILLGVAAIWIIASGRKPRADILQCDRAYWTGVAFAVAASFCWAIGILALRPALALTSLEFANVIRMSLATLVIPIFSYSAYRQTTFPRGRLRFAILIFTMGATAVATSYFLTTSIYRSGAAVASILSSMAPIFAAPLAWMIFQEAFTPRTVLALLFGMSGIVLVVTN